MFVPCISDFSAPFHITCFLSTVRPRNETFGHTLLKRLGNSFIVWQLNAAYFLTVHCRSVRGMTQLVAAGSGRNLKEVC